MLNRLVTNDVPQQDTTGRGCKTRVSRQSVKRMHVTYDNSVFLNVVSLGSLADCCQSVCLSGVCLSDAVQPLMIQMMDAVSCELMSSEKRRVATGYVLNKEGYDKGM